LNILQFYTEFPEGRHAECILCGIQLQRAAAAGQRLVGVMFVLQRVRTWDGRT